MPVAGDPRGVLDLNAGRRHSQRSRDWRVGHLITALRDKAEAAGVAVEMLTSGARPPPARVFPAGSQASRDTVHLPALRAGRAP